MAIWRYFRLNRFIEFAESGQSHFARLDQFHDQFEGVLPPGTVTLPKDGFTNQPRRPGDELTDFQKLVRDLNRIGKLCHYANCWYMSEYESEAMWRLVGSDGVAIQSSFARLRESFVSELRSVHIGEAQYFDFRTEQPPTYGNTLAIAFNKRKEFEHEKELRAVVVHEPENWTSGSLPYAEYRDKHPRGLKVVTDLKVLVERLVLAPECSVAARNRVLEVMEHSGLERSIVPSVLDDGPTLL